MAAKRRDPTEAGRRQLEGKLRSVLNGNLEFISIKNMQNWYGRYDDTAVTKLETAWKHYWEAQHKTPRRAPKLLAIGPIANLKGYAVCRNDKRNDWLN